MSRMLQRRNAQTGTHGEAVSPTFEISVMCEDCEEMATTEGCEGTPEMLAPALAELAAWAAAHRCEDTP